MRIRLAVLVAAACLLGLPAVAAADPTSSPEPGALLTSAPDHVALELEARSDALRVLVTDAAGVRRDVGTPAWEGTRATVALDPGLAPGSYTVDWRTLDLDGAPRSGTFLFTVAPVTEAAALVGDRTSGPLWSAAALALAVGGTALVRVARLRRA